MEITMSYNASNTLTIPKLSLKIRYHADIEPIVLKDGDYKGEWIDLRAANDFTIKEGSYAAIDLGISIQLPEGFEAWIVPRSSTYKNFGLIQVNSPGIVDNSFCGENDILHMLVFCLTGKQSNGNSRFTEIKKNDRICQMRIMNVMPNNLVIETVDHLYGKDRGGFGSTGIQ